MSIALKGMLPTPTNSWQDELLDDLDEMDGSSAIIAESSSTPTPTPAPARSTALATTTPSQSMISRGPTVRRAPPYLQRKHWVPRELEDFDDGGAFPEIHVPQYPLKMGQRTEGGASTTGQIVPLEVDETGKVKYDAIVKQRMRKGTWVHTGFQGVMEKTVDEADLALPDEDAVREATERTQRELEKIVNTRIQSSKPTSVALNEDANKKTGPTFLRYTPQANGGAFASGAKQRIISLVEAQRDPMEPPKHRHKKVPGGIPSPPPPVQHSPPKKLTVEDQKNWKIPSCISNWKNPKGYTIPLDKRMAADGSGVSEQPMNNDFGQFMEALYIAEQNAREEVRRRNELQKKKLMKEKEATEDELRRIAAMTRSQRAGIAGSSEAQDSGFQQRQAVREERKRTREDERRDAMKKSKTSRDRDRDVSEKIALGQAGRLTRKGEGLYDSRLFNQEQGLGGGLEQEDAYNIYDKPLMKGSSANQLYRPNMDRVQEYQEGGDGLVESLLDQGSRPPRPDRGFQGATGSSGRRDKPVEFEREEDVEEEEEEDPFELEEFMGKARGGDRKEAKESGRSGYMQAAAGGSSGDTSSNRSRLGFRSGE